MRWTLPLLAAVAVACGDAGSGSSPSSSEPPFVGAPITSSEDSEDITCGVHCEPGSVRECGAGIEVCAPSGLGWSACGAEEFERTESKCAKGTRCVARPSGDLSLCEKECKGDETSQACDDCRQVKVYGGLMGCRAICQATSDGGCDGGLELVRCEIETPRRAEVAGCQPGPEGKTYCCPGGSAILNPLFGCPRHRRHP